VDLALRAAADGLGIAYVLEARAEMLVRTGQLVQVLEEWAQPIEGFYLYYPGRRRLPAALRALIDMIRRSRDAATSKADFAAETTLDNQLATM